jgi:hypothetical protein
MSDTTRPNGDELDDQLTIAETDGSEAKDPTAVGGADEVLPQAPEQPDPPVGLP